MPDGAPAATAGSGSSLMRGEPDGGSGSLLQRPANAYTWPDDEPGFATYRATVSLYAASLPVYFSYRWCCSIAWHLPGVRAYQAFVCACEVYGACCVLLLGIIRFRRPWASQQPLPPSTDADGDLTLGDDAPGAHTFQGPFDVAVLIPCCSEPDDLVFGTVRAALALRHPLATRVTVWLLDDGAKPSRSERLARLAPPANARYVARPKSKPHHGKAGNLNYTLRHVLYPQGPAPNAVLVVLDCDQEPHADFLEQTLPYLHTQPRTALVQTPQHFYNVVPSADIFNHHNGSFFYAVQPGLDAWEATVCCGTNFVARSAAVCEVGWFPTESITEDFLLSMKLSAAGHVVRYHAAAAVTGEAPEDLRQVFKQRSRWCCGCFQVFLHPQTPRLLARLRPMQALCYLNAPLGYLGTVITLPLWAVVPVFSLAAGLHPVQALTPAFIASWCVYYALIVAVCDLMPPRLNRHLSAFTASKANASFWACYALAIGSAVVGAVLPSMQMQFQTTEKRGFSADASLRRAAAPPPACAPAGFDTAAWSASYPPSSTLETQPLTVDASSGIRHLVYTEAARGANGGAATLARLAAPAEEGRAGKEEAGRQPNGRPAAPAEGAEARDSSFRDVRFHATVVLAALAVLGLHLPDAHAEGSSRGVNLALLSALWLLLNVLPLALPLAYALLPHSYRLHQRAVRAAWFSHSALTCLVAVLLLQHLVLCQHSHRSSAGRHSHRYPGEVDDCVNTYQ